MATVFVSYNRDSQTIVKSLAEDIELLGHTVWFDHLLSGGQTWWDQILARVRSCDIFVLVLNPETLASAACKREYGYAAALGKPILPVLVSDGVSIGLLPPQLSMIQHVDYRERKHDTALRLARAVMAVPPPGPLPDPLPPAPEAPISYLGSLTDQVEKSSPMSYQEQTALLLDLKRSLHDPDQEEDARKLLLQLRRRRDLLATVAEEIDEAIGRAGKTIPVPDVPTGMPSATPPGKPVSERDTTKNKARGPTRSERSSGASEPSPEAQALGSQPMGLGGWLVPAAIGLALTLIWELAVLIRHTRLVALGYPAMHAPMGVVSLAFLVFGAFVATRFFRLKRNVPSLFIATMIAGTFVNAAQYGIVVSQDYTYARYLIDILSNERLSMNAVLGFIVFAAVEIPYFLKSKRVKATFVK